MENKDYPLLNSDISLKPNIKTSYPLAEEIVALIRNKKVSYAEACEALNIAYSGIETLVLR
jgi:predicted XRE-type DNA-binding protein